MSQIMMTMMMIMMMPSSFCNIASYVFRFAIAPIFIVTHTCISLSFARSLASKLAHSFVRLFGVSSIRMKNTENPFADWRHTMKCTYSCSHAYVQRFVHSVYMCNINNNECGVEMNQ